MTQKLFSTRQAAEYLGLSLSAIKYHIHEAKTITGELIGNSLIFTQEELDRFKENKRPQGRPRKDEKSCNSS